MNKVVAFEWRRLYRSHLAAGLLGLAVLLSLLFFWFTKVGVDQYRQELLRTVTHTEETVGGEIGLLREQIKTSDQPAEKKQLKTEFNQAGRIDDGLMAQIEAIQRRQSAPFLRGGIHARQEDIRYARQFQNGLLADPKQNRAVITEYQARLTHDQAFENLHTSLQPPIFLVNWQHLLANPVTLILAVLLFSTIWVMAQFTANGAWMQLNVFPSRRWLIANGLVMVMSWFGWMVFTNAIALLVSVLWGQPLLSGQINWLAQYPGTNQSYLTMWLRYCGQSWLSFSLGYFIWLALTQLIQQRRRRQ
ncbi:hypothetical protein [Schleiferilactobacillus perolens]|jgi:hypothetical protein|uniref:hypothetical protein n=1 Tax=Schleiferilactobacillus perolens TaxID=100468 RepID=UPI002353C2BB|nr:hypothetical protein [Schleiferilactobacillus perolens]MCI2172141.1 hypothetical protein [Schleiferilactobacillus perolens]